MMRRIFPLFVLGLVALAGSVSPAWAVLGETQRTVEGDRIRLQGELKSIAGAGFSIQQIATPSGIIIKEYISPAGVVFGVSWRGPVAPDLSQLLGTYYEQFRQAASVRSPYRLRHIMIHSDKLVVEAGGHMRDLHGRAYVPALLPVGVSATSVE